MHEATTLTRSGKLIALVLESTPRVRRTRAINVLRRPVRVAVPGQVDLLSSRGEAAKGYEFSRNRTGRRS